jgi:uncharacterized membrane protein
MLKTLILLFFIDMVYIYAIGMPVFNKQIKDVQGTEIKIDIVATLLTYVLIATALYYFIIKDKRPVHEAFLLGLCIYGVYELTSKSLLDKWSWNTVVIDTLCGGILFSLTTYLLYKIPL